MGLSVLEVLSVRPRCDGVDAVLVVDDDCSELAYRAHVELDARDEWVSVSVRAWWRNDLRERPVHPARAGALEWEMRRVVECDADVMQRLIDAHRDHVDDVRVYDRLGR